MIQPSNHNSHSRSRVRDVLLYLLIAVVIVGTQLALLIEKPDVHISNRVGASVFTGIIVAVYVIKSFKTKLRLVRFWIVFLGLLTIHFSWTLFVPMIFTVFGMGVEFFVFAVVLDHFFKRTTHSTT